MTVRHPLVLKTAKHSVSEIADRLCERLKAKNINVFARIDHSKAASENGLNLAPEQVVVFGDPKVGTFLMQECPAVGYELPLRIIIWEEGGTQVGYRDPMHLLEDYQLEQHRAIVEKMSHLMGALVDELVAS